MKRVALAFLLLLAAAPSLLATNVSANITTNTTWTAAGNPYVLTTDISVGSPTGATLTIQAGVVVMSPANKLLRINAGSNKGALVVNGTQAAPVLFTSTDTATPAYWGGLTFETAAAPPPSTLTHAIIEYAGGNSSFPSGITVAAHAPAFQSVTIRNNKFAGLRITGGSASLNQCQLSSNTGPGLNVVSGTALTLTNTQFTGNSGYAATLPATLVLTSASGNTASGNAGGDVIQFRGGVITSSTTWPAPGIPYVVTGTIDVMAASAPVLTIAPGNTIKFDTNSQISCNQSNKGALQANGTAASPILFTSNGSAAAGSWWGLWFGPTAAAPQSSVSYATIEYAGSNGFGRGGIAVHAGSPVFDHVTVRNNQYAGVSFTNGAPVITSSTINGNGGPGVYSTGGTGLTLTGNSLTNNNGYAVTLPIGVVLASSGGNAASGNGTGRDAVEYRGGIITASRTWPVPGIPYVVTGTIDVMAASAPVLTIDPGNTIRFNSNSQISCNQTNKGALQANGTAASPILFTSNGTAAAGSWYGLWFGPTAAAPQSSVSHATIEYAGSNGFARGGIAVHAGSPVFDHVTVRNNQYAGVSFTNGAPVVTSSTITGNGGPGIHSTGGTGLTLTNNSITNNSGYAVTLPVGVVLTASANTATGNTGGNAIQYRAGLITSNTTWPAPGIPYVVSGTIDVMHANAPVLTIAPGNTVKFDANSQISCNQSSKGALQANGTAAAPIVFTSNTTATAGSWWGLWFGPTAAAPQSSVSYATIEYAGSNGFARGGITVNANSPQFDHLIVRNNQHSGLTAANSTPRITNTHFSGNPKGIHTTGTAAVQATLNYWDSPAGACLPGQCTGGQQSVTAAVTFEPWLLAAPAGPQFLATATHKNPIFNPPIGTTTWLDYTTSLAGSVEVTIRNAADELVRTLTAAGTPNTIHWDGKNESGTIQPDGTYRYDVAATAPSQPPATIARGTVVIDSTRALTLSNPAVSFAFFSPNGDAVQDTTTVSAAANFDDTLWTVRVLDGASNVVRSQEGSGPAVSFVWDGRNGTAVLQPDGLYTLSVEVSIGKGPVLAKSTAATLDNALPSAAIATPAANAVLSNVHANGSTVVATTGTAADLNMLSWTMQMGTGLTPPSWSTIATGTTPVSGALFHSWETVNLSGTYSLRLLVSDKAGNAASTITPVSVGHFKVTQSAYQFNGSIDGTITYTSTVPFPVTESIVIRNLAGTVVRNLVTSAARNAGTFNDVFNGLNNLGELLPDGPYFYTATVTAGASTFTWDLSNVMRNDGSGFNDNLGVQAYDPFDNKPMKFNYNFNLPGRVSVATTITPGSVIGECLTPTASFFCPAVEVWQESGPQSFTWWGLDHTGSYRTIRSVAIVTTTNKFPKNAVVLFGTRPKLTNVKVTPPVFGPAAGLQAIEFDLTTFKTNPADISIAIVNLESKSTLRTLTIAAKPPGHGLVQWDGRAYNGMLVAPGRYAIEVTATDPIGNVVRSGILTTIQY